MTGTSSEGEVEGIHSPLVLRHYSESRPPRSMIDITPAAKGHNKLADALAEVKARFTAANPRSLARWESARAVMPGGNTRTVLHYDPFPLTMVKGEGEGIHSPLVLRHHRERRPPCP